MLQAVLDDVKDRWKFINANACELMSICIAAFADVHSFSCDADVGMKAGGATTVVADAVIQGAGAMSEAASNLQGSATAIFNESSAMVQKGATT